MAKVSHLVKRKASPFPVKALGGESLLSSLVTSLHPQKQKTPLAYLATLVFQLAEET